MSDSEITYVRKAGVASTPMDGEIVMMDIDQGKYFGISGAGRVIWDLLAEPRGVDALAAGVCAEYDVDPAVARKDVETFLESLIRRNLVDKV